MRTIIAGSREISKIEFVSKAVELSRFDISVIISGGARGVDLLGEQFAYMSKIPVERFPANWEKYGKMAGYIRNEEMADHAEALIAIWDGKSRGTEHMIKMAKYKKLKVWVGILKQDKFVEEIRYGHDDNQNFEERDFRLCS